MTFPFSTSRASRSLFGLLRNGRLRRCLSVLTVAMVSIVRINVTHPQSRLKRVVITVGQDLDKSSGNMYLGIQIICRLSALTSRVEFFCSSTYPNHRDYRESVRRFFGLYNASTVRLIPCVVVGNRKLILTAKQARLDLLERSGANLESPTCTVKFTMCGPC